MLDAWNPLRFIGEQIEVQHAKPPVLTKKPDPPRAFTWHGVEHEIDRVLSQWFDYQRKGEASRNMRPAHLRAAARRGSRGVGRFYFRVETGAGRVFDLYYDRAPKDAEDRKGSWVLWRELQEQQEVGH